SQGAAKRIGLLLSAIRRTEAPGLTVGSGPLVLSHLLLKRLRKPLRAPAHSVDRTALAVDGAVRITLAKRAFRVAHGAVGISKIVAAIPLLTLLALLALLTLLAILTFLVLAETTLLHLLQKLFQLLAQRLLIPTQFAKGVRIALLALLPLLPLLAALSSLTLLAALPAPLVLALAEGLIAQLLLLANHVAKLVKHRHHVVVAVLPHLTRPRHLQVLHHLRQLIEQLPRG